MDVNLLFNEFDDFHFVVFIEAVVLLIFLSRSGPNGALQLRMALSPRKKM